MDSELLAQIAEKIRQEKYGMAGNFCHFES
jgi:hypothetical protein